MPAERPATWLAYHLVHAGPGGTMPADPNCTIFWKGRYHLHYIFQNRFGHAFAHVSSDDMVRWTWHPTVLSKDWTGHDMFSGTAFLTKEGRPAIIYHGQGSRFNQIAFAVDDDLDTWTKPERIEAVTAAGQPSAIKYWDPDCWLDGDTYNAISGGKPASLLKSPDLKTWQDLGQLFHDDFQRGLGTDRNEDVSCANMFRIGDKWMLLCISHRLGCRYFLGTFKDGKFLPDFHALMNWRGVEVFAPESLLTPDGRRVMWAWCRLPGVPQGGVQSLPRELELPADGVLRIRPLRELESLRGQPVTRAAVRVASSTTAVVDGVQGNTLEIAATFAPPTGQACGLRVLCDDQGQGGSTIRYEPDRGSLVVDGLVVPLVLAAGEPLALRVFVDRTMVEVFANDRQAAIVGCRTPAGTSVALLAEGADAVATQITAWPLESIY